MKLDDSFDGRQLSAARALLGISIVELAEAANVTPRTIHRLEIGGVISISERKKHDHVTRDVWERIVSALRSRGVDLTSDDGQRGSGVRWIKSRAARAKAT